MDKALLFKWIKRQGFREWLLLALAGYLLFGGYRMMAIAMSEEKEFSVSSSCGNDELLATDFVAQMSTTAELNAYADAIQQQARAYECLDEGFGDDTAKSLAHYFWNEAQWLAKDARDDEIEWVKDYGFSPEDCLNEFQRSFCILRNYGQQAIKGMATASNPVDRERWRDQYNAVNRAFDGDIIARDLPVPAQPAMHVLNARFIKATAGYSSREMFIQPDPMSIEHGGDE